jgi:hypothetical protein
MPGRQMTAYPRVEKKMQLIAYHYGFVTAVSLMVFALALKMPTPAMRGASNTHLFQVGPALTSRIKNEWLALAIRGALITTIALAGLTAIWLLQSYFRSFLYAYFVCMNFVGATLCVYLYATPLSHRVDTRVVLVGSIAAGSAIAGACYMWPSWLTYDLMAVVLGCLIAGSASITHMRYLVIGLLAIALYDAVGTLGTPMMTSLASGSGSGFLPGMVILVPVDPFSLPKPDATNVVGLLGLGDIVFSCFAVLTAAQYRLQWLVIAGYVLGLVVTDIALHIFHRGMPAMIFLAPSLLLSLYFGARYRNKKILW